MHSKERPEDCMNGRTGAERDTMLRQTFGWAGSRALTQDTQHTCRQHTHTQAAAMSPAILTHGPRGRAPAAAAASLAAAAPMQAA